MLLNAKLSAVALIATSLAVGALTSATAAPHGRAVGVSAARSSLPTTTTCGGPGCGASVPHRPPNRGTNGGDHGSAGGGGGLDGADGISCFSVRDCGPLRQD